MISRHTGVTISEIESIEQSIEDIVTTPLGSRVMRGDYGSIVPDLIDQPMNDVLVLKFTVQFIRLLLDGKNASVLKISTFPRSLQGLCS